MTRIYLDNNATTALAPEVLETMHIALASGPANPSSIHSFGREAKAKLLHSRDIIASYFGVKTKELIFTSGGTEALNFLLKGTIQYLPKGKILTSSIEHSSVEATLSSLEKEGWTVERLPVGSTGAIDKKTIESAIDETIKLLIFSAVNSETGVKAPIDEIATLSVLRGIPLIVDGVAWLGKEPISLHPGISGIAFSSHKIHGPKGIGLAIVRPSLKVAPLLSGGAQEGGRRAGTENLEGIIGFAKAIELLKTVQHDTIANMRDHFEQLLIEGCGAQVNGQGNRVCNTSNLYFPGIDGETLLIQLDLAGIAASHGSACSAGAQEPSRVLLNMGYSEKVARSSLRFSLSRYTTKEEIESAASIISSIVHILMPSSDKK
jgi:cysteine desulfurase